MIDAGPPSGGGPASPCDHELRLVELDLAGDPALEIWRCACGEHEAVVEVDYPPTDEPGDNDGA